MFWAKHIIGCKRFGTSHSRLRWSQTGVKIAAVKRRVSKHRDFHIEVNTREIWRIGRAEKIYLTSAGAGLICCENLAAELDLLVFDLPVVVTKPNIRRLTDELGKPR